ncbi:MAG: TolC family protein [Bacteroidetes bacterium]|nr:TolC family protein [Bacteroidota bacterium]
MKRLLITFSLILPGLLLMAQDVEQLSLQEAYEMLETRYPKLKDTEILSQIRDNQLLQLQKQRLPQISLKADGRLQSESTSLEPEPGTMIPFEIDLPLYSLRTYVEGQYTLLDGGYQDGKEQLAEAQFLVDQQFLEVEKHQLQQRINQLFIGINLQREQLALFDLSLNELNTRREVILAGVENGVLLPSDLDRLDVRIIEIEAAKSNLENQLQGMINSLSGLTGVNLAPDVQLSWQDWPEVFAFPAINRPETDLLQLQQNALLSKEALIDAGRKPKLGVYAQAGVGYPNPLNILDNSVSPYALVGVNFQWPLLDWKYSRLQKEELQLQALKLDHAAQTLTFNIESAEAAYTASIQALESQIEYDQKIALLQARILDQLGAQLEEGVITSADYVAQVNTELKARQNLLIHQLKLKQTQLDFLWQRGYFNQ